jgi:hypothetical protein
LREALARSDNDFLVAEPRRKKPAPRNHAFSALLAIGRFVRGLATYPNRIAGALLVGLAVAIAVNALELQTSRHPAPFFSQTVTQAVNPAPETVAPVVPVAPSAAPMPSDVAPAQTSAPGKTDPLGQFIRQKETPRPTATVPEPARRPDPISQILRETSDAPAPQPSRTVLAAQRALVKLGYVLQPDGIAGEATRKAILQYEADHRLPQRGELSAKLIRTLSRAANIAIP